jgi:predicted RecA/RadA family phage recombinase
MVTETGLKLRTKLESAKTLRAVNESTTDTLEAGAMTVAGDTIGLVVEDAAPGEEFVLVYEAEKVVVPKAEAAVFAAGDLVYYDPAAGNVTDVSTSNQKCGRALEAAGTSDDEALIDLIVLG